MKGLAAVKVSTFFNEFPGLIPETRNIFLPSWFIRSELGPCLEIVGDSRTVCVRSHGSLIYGLPPLVFVKVGVFNDF